MNPPQATLQALLGAEHEALRARFELVLSAFHAGARDEAAQLWLEFDCELREHFELEERYLLPELAIAAPAEASALRTEHTDLRRRLERLGSGLDLHLTREESVAEFFATLSTHAANEETLLYRFADRHLPERGQSAIRALLLDARRRFVARRDAARS